MTRDEIYHEISETLGLIPRQLQNIPDQFLEQEWNLWKSIMTQETPIPAKYKELMCIGLASMIDDEYGIFFHTEAAKMYGATDEEIQNAAYLTKMVGGWAPYSRANGIGLDEFKSETSKMMDYVKARGQTRKKAA